MLIPWPGAERILAAHGPALPQPDQLCGPFSAWAALHAVTASPPPVTELAVAAGTRVWPHDEPAWRPPGAPLVRAGWDRLPVTDQPATSGTHAAGLVAGIAALCPGVVVVPSAGPPSRALLDAVPVGVVANVRTGPIAPPGLTWDVGHFVVLWGSDGADVVVADTYAELGAPGLPPGCRPVDGEALDRALAGRGVLLLARAEDADVVAADVVAAGRERDLWST